jgi:hypothetical protein
LYHIDGVSLCCWIEIGKQPGVALSSKANIYFIWIIVLFVVVVRWREMFTFRVIGKPVGVRRSRATVTGMRHIVEGFCALLATVLV